MELIRSVAGVSKFSTANKLLEVKQERRAGRKLRDDVNNTKIIDYTYAPNIWFPV